MAWTQAELDRIAYHLGYSLDPALMTVAIPSLGGQGEAMVRTYLTNLDACETQIAGAAARLKVAVVGDITLRRDEVASLESMYRGWQGRLSNLLGVEINPLAYQGGGVNVPRIP